MLKLHQEPVIQEIRDEWIKDSGAHLFIKREDLIHPTVSGNKWRKLKYNIIRAREEGHDSLLTFGGAYSNHIYATAAAAREAGFKSIGVIRGEELVDKPLNKTLTFAKECGMRLHFVSRSYYRNKSSESFIEKLVQQFGRFYLLPEGGTNNLAIKGSEEIVDNEIQTFDTICLPVGTGGTITGVIAASKSTQEVLGFSALKGDFLKDEVKRLLTNYQLSEDSKNLKVSKWHIDTNYHFGGYAKTNAELLSFIQNFEAQHAIPLDPVYTGKMMYGIYDKIKKGHFDEGSKILVIHTGGLQGKQLS